VGTLVPQSQHDSLSQKNFQWLCPVETVYCWKQWKQEARILQLALTPSPAPTLQKKFLQSAALCTDCPHPTLTVHSCLAPSGPWFRVGLGLKPADLGASPALSSSWCRPPDGPSRPDPFFWSCPQPCLPWHASREPQWGQSGLPAPVHPALMVLQWAVPGHHFPLLLQSLGVKCRHLESIRRSRLSIALSCPSTISSDRVRMYWPWTRDGPNS
jgi:hypothetical protein